MAILRSWWLPVLLGVGQLALWPGRILLTHETVNPVKATVVVVVTVVVTVALGRRRSEPVHALGVLVVALLTGVLVAPDTSDVVVLAFTDLIALYSVAARRVPRVAAWSALAVLIGQALQLTRMDVTEQDLMVGIPLSIVGIALTTALGLARGRWRQARADAAERLARAEAERAQAAAAERDRLARELHDVTAHHLTAIVVHAGAARRLATARPELVEPALEFAADTGRRTLTALHRLVAMITPDQAGDEPFALRLNRVVAAAGRVGQPVRLGLSGSVAALPADLADAVHAVVREAVTNAMRYAAGASISVVIRTAGPEIEVLVTNGPRAAEAVVPEPLGSGRGLAGLRARLADLGGSLDAGPDGDGWRVAGRLPQPADDCPAGAPKPTWWRPIVEDRLLDLTVTAFTTLVPLLLLLVVDQTEPDLARYRNPDVFALTALLIVLHGLPVWWRRTAPWRALGAVLAAAAGFVLATWLAHLPAYGVLILLVGGLAEVVCVWAVAAYGRPKVLTWLAVLAAAALAPVELCAMMLLVDGPDPLRDGTDDGWFTFFLLGAGFGLIATVGYTVLWLAAFLLRLSRENTLATEENALARTAWAAAAATRDQQERFAAGLRASVLEPAERLIAAAAGDELETALDRVVAEARAGLAAMRELLGALQPELPAGSAPPRGTADLDELCAERREAGREVTLSAQAPPYPLPVAVDLSGYRIVDAALDTEDTQACAVGVAFVDGCLVVTVHGAPSATSGTVAARIRARTAALGGTVRFGPDGRVTVRLPAPREEVRTSLVVPA